MEWINQIVYSTGFLCLFALGACIFIVGFQLIKHAINKICLVHKQKHRFDKPPTAKCYCIDCANKIYITSSKCNECPITGRYVADEWFCSDARPKTR